MVVLINKKTFRKEVEEILAKDLKFYLTEFGQREDLARIAKKIDELARRVNISVKSKK